MLFEGKSIVPIDHIKLLQNRLKATEGTKLLPHLILEPLSADYVDIYYTSDDVSIATVDEYGIIDCLKCGNTRINVNVVDYENNLYTVSCELEVIGGTSGIEAHKETTPTKIVGYYNLHGQKIKSPKKGVNIIKMSNGKSKKVFF